MKLTRSNTQLKLIQTASCYEWHKKLILRRSKQRQCSVEINRLAKILKGNGQNWATIPISNTYDIKNDPQIYRKQFPMKHTIWNIRGVGAQKKVLHRICKENKLKVVVLFEPMSWLDVDSICRRFRYDEVIINTLNKIWCLFDNTIRHEVLVDDKQFLHLKLTSAESPTPFFVTIIYAKCDRGERRKIWDACENYRRTQAH